MGVEAIIERANYAVAQRRRERHTPDPGGGSDKAFGRGGGQ